MHWRRKWQPTAVLLPVDSQGQGSLVGCRLWGRTESDTTEVTQQQQQQSNANSHKCKEGREEMINLDHSPEVLSRCLAVVSAKDTTVTAFLLTIEHRYTLKS